MNTDKKTSLDSSKKDQNHLSLVTNLAEFPKFHQSYRQEGFFSPRHFLYSYKLTESLNFFFFFIFLDLTLKH